MPGQLVVMVGADPSRVESLPMLNYRIGGNTTRRCSEPAVTVSTSDYFSVLADILSPQSTDSTYLSVAVFVFLIIQAVMKHATACSSNRSDTVKRARAILNQGVRSNGHSNKRC